MFSLENKVAFVTGSGSGIGAAIAELFAAQGALVYVAEQNADNGRRTVDAISKAGGQARFIELNVADESACRHAAEQVLAAHKGYCDILVNNAGIGHVGTILQVSSEDLDRLWNVNVKGMFYLIKNFLPPMLERRWGSIINIASMGGIMGLEDRFAYATTKHAVVGMTRCLAMDHGETQVRINCICPGRTETPFVKARLAEYADPEKYRAQMTSTHALKRMAQPPEIASAALYLAADESAYVTGSAMVVDGGYGAGK
jgi:NAD(P)-dependent dehydrogenase (short-subunit alcohol dehydrogenase family)